ncbi:hypothetical protein BDB00DRAFT_303818 [Zychaea mexicana]|uniref:uncharacterized protein n=1 Tax=Zychaea mexicana TaxID=64656 RepID=UPI0022FEF2BE|nr:uncharacterized protein BDB00DRAFT_303818 [Zychaea mexicana]KAI9494446.1 hypothetical protein BDB00DRAFT_303818 [Zychaea mexicana]
MLQNPALNQDTNDSAGNNDAMSLLSTFMLQGWVMTDQACKVPGCPVPIMRSKDGSIRFCVKHDKLPTTSSSGSAIKSSSATSATAGAAVTPAQVQQQQPAAAAAAAATTTQTDVAQSPSIEDDVYAERERRREQSSKASQLIGQRLLQRWTLLNETCPSPGCYAIPLMRDPSKHMVCVICNRSFNEDLEQESQRLDNTKETEDEPTEYKDEPTDDDDRPETDIESFEAPPAAPERRRSQQQQQQQQQQEQHEAPSEFLSFSPIADKMRTLLRRVERSSDPVELKQLFEAIEAGAGAIKACSEASEAVHKASRKFEFK